MHRIRSIDSLRALAMTAVIAQHCGLLPFGWIGVWLFFIISGFVVTITLQDRAISAAPLHRFWDFSVRRAARILPIYWISIIAGLAGSLVYTGAPQWPIMSSLGLFYFNFEEAFGRGCYTAGGLSACHLWTISVEMQFYAIYGIAFVMLSRQAMARLLLAIIAAAPVLRVVTSLLLAAHHVPRLQAAFQIYSFSALQFDAFAMGALLALLRDTVLNSAWPRRLLLAGCAAVGAYFVSYILVNVLVEHVRGLGVIKNILSGILYGDYREVFIYSAIDLLSAGIVASAVTGTLPGGRILDSAALQLVGRISYGGYVYHPVAIAAVSYILAAGFPGRSGFLFHLESDAATFLFAWAGTVGVAYLSYFWIERPIIAGAAAYLKQKVPGIAVLVT